MHLNSFCRFELNNFLHPHTHCSEKEGYVRPDHIHRSLNSDISYFGVGGKHAAFFIGDSVRVSLSVKTQISALQLETNLQIFMLLFFKCLVSEMSYYVKKSNQEYIYIQNKSKICPSIFHSNPFNPFWGHAIAGSYPSHCWTV